MLSSNQQIDFLRYFREGKEEGFTYFFNLLFRPLCLFAKTYTKDSQAAEDIVVDSLINLWAKKEIFDTETSLKNYLYRCVYNASIRWLENQKRYKKHHDRYKHQLTTTEQAYIGNIIKAETLNLLHKAIHQLPSQCKKIFTKVYIEGKSVSETAQEMNLSISTVKNQKARGIKLLKPKLAT